MSDITHKSTEHWKVLAKAINSGSTINIDNCKHLGLQYHLNLHEFENKLFTFNSIELKDQIVNSADYKWFELIPLFVPNKNYDLYSHNLYLPSLKIRMYTSLIGSEVCDKSSKRSTFLQTISGFDNTGNITLWFCELLLCHCMLFESYYPILWNKFTENFTLHPIKYVCELGSGMTGSAGLALSLHKNLNFLNVSHIVLTDGNNRCVESMKLIIEEHEKRLDSIRKSIASQTTVIEARRLCWPSEGDLEKQENGTIDSSLVHHFDLILASDCFFNREYHQGLLFTIDQLLSTRPGSTFVAVAPLRNKSLMQFVSLAQNVKPKKWSIDCMPPNEYMSQDMLSYLFDNSNYGQEVKPTLDQLEKLVGHLIIFTRC